MPAKLLKLSDGMVLYVNEYMRIRDILDAQGITVVGRRDTKTNKVKQRSFLAPRCWKKRMGGQVHPHRAGLRRRGDGGR